MAAHVLAAGPPAVVLLELVVGVEVDGGLRDDAQHGGDHPTVQRRQAALVEQHLLERVAEPAVLLRLQANAAGVRYGPPLIRIEGQAYSRCILVQ
jgi:hypothetical protein